MSDAPWRAWERRPMGDRAWRFALPEAHDPRAVLDALRAVPGAVDVVLTESHALVRLGDAAAVGAWEARPSRGTEHVIGVRYDGDDLAEVAARAGLTVDEVVALHAGVRYTVRFLGFMPGFAYLGDVDPALALPRRDTPRARVPAGSVAVAGSRTGVYPFASPGGWHLLGRVVDFVPFERDRGARWQVGDRVLFEPR